MCSKEWRLVLEVNGVVVGEDALVRTPTGWAQPSPVFCRNGHRHGPNKTLVGWRFCVNVAPEGGHRTYFCRACGDEILLPEPDERCDHRDFDQRPNRSGPDAYDPGMRQ